MAALVSKPGITRVATSSGIPKEWSQSWFRDFISDHLKLADTRNAIGANGILITGNLTQYATIGLKGPVTIPAPAAELTLATPSQGTTAAGGGAGWPQASIDLGNSGIFSYDNSPGTRGYSLYLQANTYYNAALTNYYYQTTNPALLYVMNPGAGHGWYTAPTGVAGTVAAYTEYMQLLVGGGLIIAAASAGNTSLKVNAGSSGGLYVVGTGAGTAVVRVDTSVTAGAATPTFANNKPGVNSSVAKWLPVNADGANYYIPLWT